MVRFKKTGKNVKGLKKSVAPRKQVGLLLDDDDFCTYDDKWYGENCRYEEEFCGEEASAPIRKPLTVDLLSMQLLERAVPKPKPKPSKKNTKYTFSSSVQRTNAQTNDDPLAHLLTVMPRIVRSKSFTSEQHVLVDPTAASLHRRSSSLTGLCTGQCSEPATFSSAVSLDVTCVQSLIPARPSVVGPSPRASLTVDARKHQAAVLLTWSLDAPDPSVRPLVGCSEQTAQKMQHEIRNCLASKQETGFKAYWEMSTTIHERLDEWQRLLTACLDSTTPGQNRWKNLVQVCNKVNMTLGQCYSHYDMLQDFKDNTEENAKFGNPEKLEDDQVYLVCFEDIDPQSNFQLISCGHKTCIDCSKSHLKSAVASGQGSIRCAAFKCNVSVNLFDAAHILTEKEDHDTWERLVRCALERTASFSGSRFCPGADCGRLLKPSVVADSQDHGFNMLTCDCGINICRDCNNQGHPGVTCTDYTKLSNAINSGKLDAEIANINWVMQHSRPCPKCRYPIEKNGGCNHVRCQQCSYYFCFQCGGEGQLCMACKIAHKYWQDDADYDEKRYSGSATLVEKYRAFRHTKAKLEDLQKTLAGRDKDTGNDIDELLLEIQCCQVRMWLHTFIVARMMANEVSTTTGMVSLQLDLIIHAFSFRNLFQQTKIRRRQEALAAAMGLIVPKRKCHNKNSRESWNVLQRQFSSFQQIFADQELEELCRMGTTQLARKIAVVIQAALKILCPSTTKTSIRGRRSTPADVASPLNQKMERPNDPWRNSYRANANEEKWSDDENLGKKKPERWKKSKEVVSAKRAKTLGLNEL